MSTAPNPYQSPAADAPAPGDLVSGEELRRIASYQRGINLMLIANLGVVGWALALGSPKNSVMSMVIVVAVIAIVVCSCYFTFTLARLLYGLWPAVLFSFMLLAPCLHLIALLIVSQGATGRLTAAGYRVGLLGVDPKTIE